MSVDKRDLATVVTLSLVFFLMATWNLGLRDVPLSSWQVSTGKSFYIDLGNTVKVDAVYVLLKQGRMNVRVYTGSPNSWIEEKNAFLYDYYCWRKIDLNSETRFIRFVFESSSGEIIEIAVLGQNGQKIEINAVKSEKEEVSSALNRLIDEQEKVECPPTYMSETYFDEIYYVRTAEEYLNLEEPYEWTHPPLGKLIMAAGIVTFGYSPFGWRIIGVIFATLMIPVIYFLGKKMFGSWIGAFTSAFLLTFDFMHFTMGRMATVDTFVVFFSLVSQFFFYSYLQRVLREGWKTSIRPLFLAVLFFSLGFSTKWYVMYGFLGQIFILLVLRIKDVFAVENGWAAKIKAFFSHPFLMVLGFVAVAVAVYFLTFIPYMMVGHSFKDVYYRQWSMYNYHSKLKATHPFSSQWWSWPVILRPVWLYVSDLTGGMVSTIAAMGNPAVWWVGLGSIVSAVEKSIREKNKVCLFIVAIFFFQWLPYGLIPRCLFLYHFYINVPFLCLATAYFLSESWDKKRGKTVVLAYLVVVVALFAVFYPVTSGYPAPYGWIDRLKWFRSWVF